MKSTSAEGSGTGGGHGGEEGIGKTPWLGNGDLMMAAINRPAPKVGAEKSQAVCCQPETSQGSSLQCSSWMQGFKTSTHTASKVHSRQELQPPSLR